jgi:hypothetical protein
MKKVRYAIGAVGAAPALGLLIPAANAAVPAVQTAQGNVGKTVSVRHHDGKTPQVNCGSSQVHHTLSTRKIMVGFISYSGNICVRFQSTLLDRRQGGLTERVRYYSGGGRLERTTWQGGSFINSHETEFSSFPNMYAHEVCQALVANSNHNDVKYGPVCEKT